MKKIVSINSLNMVKFINQEGPFYEKNRDFLCIINGIYI